MKTKTYKYASIESVPLEKMSDIISRKLVYGERAMLAQVFLKKGAVVPEHHHESEQITWIVEGALKFQIDGDEVLVKAGETLVIPSHMPHSAVAMEDTVDIDIFAPLRQDWISKDDEYLRRGEKA
jgi:quercetin dioxygenase-like cupin family protein